MNLCTLSECESWHCDGLCVRLIVFHKLWRSSLIMYLFLRERLCEGCKTCYVLHVLYSVRGLEVGTLAKLPVDLKETA